MNSESFHSHPLKLYIQDAYRAERTTENKYIYRIFGLSFKNLMIHGVITSINNSTDKMVQFEVGDPTGTIQIYHNYTKSNTYIQKPMMDVLNRGLTDASIMGDANLGILSKLLDRINKSKLTIAEGDYISIVGDIFLDDKGTRMICAYECHVTSVERDIVWLNELRCMYDKYYLTQKYVLDEK